MFSGFQSHTLATLHYYDSTDCSAFHAPAILKTFEIRPGRTTFSCFYGLHRHTVLPTYYDATDCSAFHAAAILKTFEIRPGGLLSHVFTGSKVMRFHVNMKRMTF